MGQGQRSYPRGPTPTTGARHRSSAKLSGDTAEANAQVQRVQIGEVDIAYSLRVDQVEAVRGSSNLQLLVANSLALCYMGLNAVEAEGQTTGQEGSSAGDRICP